MKENRVIDFKYAPERPQCCIGLVDDYYKSIVREDGSLNFGFEGVKSVLYYMRINDELFPVHDKFLINRGFKFRYKPSITYRDKLIEVRQDFGDPSAAIVTTTEEYEASRLTWKTFAYLSENNARADVVLWKLEAKDNFTTTRATVVLNEMGYERDNSFEIKSTFGIKTTEKDGVMPYHFTAGEVKEGAFFIVHNGTLSDSEITLEGAKKTEKQAEKYWSEVKPFVKKMQIPDEQIMDMLKSCGRNILQAREIHNNELIFQVGPTEYRGLWFVDGHFILESVHMMGRHEEAYAGLDAVLSHTHPDGSVQILENHDKETGIAIATTVRQCELMGNDERLKELWPTLLNALGYIKSQREKAKALGEDYVGYGLFPPCMGDGGIDKEPEYTTPLWVMHGLKAGYEAGKRLNLEGYEDFKAEFDSIKSAFIKSAKRDMRYTDDGIPYFPMSMLTPEEVEKKVLEHTKDYNIINHEIYKPQTGIWAYSQAIYPGEVFEPDDEFVLNLLKLLDSVDNTEGIPENTGWMCHNALWPYGSMFDAHAWLYSGRGDKAVDYLYAFANHASPARCWREEQALKGTNSDEMVGDMPHNWGSAMFIYLTRNLILLEKKGNIELFAGLPDEWLPTDDKPLILEQTPTRYGFLTLEFKKTGEGYTLKYDKNGSRNPKNILIHWDGEINGVEYEIINDGLISIKGDINSFEAVLKKGDVK